MVKKRNLEIGQKLQIIGTLSNNERVKMIVEFAGNRMINGRNVLDTFTEYGKRISFYVNKKGRNPQKIKGINVISWHKIHITDDKRWNKKKVKTERIKKRKITLRDFTNPGFVKVA